METFIEYAEHFFAIIGVVATIVGVVLFFGWKDDVEQEQRGEA